MLPKSPLQNLVDQQKAIADAAAQSADQSPTPEPAVPSTTSLSFTLSTRRNLVIVPHGAQTTADRFGRSGRAFVFDGVDDFLEISGTPALPFPQFTLVVTFKIFRQPSDREVYASTTAGVFSHRDMALVTQSPYLNLKVSVYGGATYPEISCWGRPWGAPDHIETNQYYQVAIRYGEGTFRLSINGAQKFEKVDVPAPVPSTNAFVIGKTLNTEHPDFFNGVIDEVYLCDWPLANEELTRLYQSGAW